MEIEQARKVLLRSRTPAERQAAVEAAMRAGMPIERIEAILDWLDHLLPSQTDSTGNSGSSGESSKK